MKRIDELDKLPGKIAKIEKAKRDGLMTMPEKLKAYLKNEYFSGVSERREKQKLHDRRSFLEMVGKAGISTKMLQASTLLGGVMANRHALAQDPALNKRVVFCYLNSGADNANWLPSGVNAMAKVTRPYAGVADICHFREVNVIMNGHEDAKQALGSIRHSGAPTMDRRIADYLGTTTPYKSIYLGAQAKGGAACSNIGPVEDSPSTAYSKFFEGPLPEGDADDTYLDAYNAQIAALAPLRNKLSLEERDRLDSHEAAIIKIRQNMMDQLAGNGPDPSACTNIVGGLATSNIQEHGKTQADIITAAFACGLTKVATLQLGNEQGGWRGHNTVYNGDAHGTCHSTPNADANDEIVEYLSQVPAYFIQKLRDTAGPDGKPLIETTVFVQVTCMGNGRDHSPGNGPFIVATQMPGFKGGFSKAVAGTTEDLNGAIPKGMGIDAFVTPMGSNTLGLLS